MAATAESILDLIVNLIKGDDKSSHRLTKILVAFWGCTVFHGTLVVAGTGLQVFDPLVLEELGIVLLLALVFYSLVFALIAAYSGQKGSLVRYFLRGVTPPASAYLVAGLILSYMRVE